jgi:hypothetical protein
VEPERNERQGRKPMKMRRAAGGKEKDKSENSCCLALGEDDHGKL